MVFATSQMNDGQKAGSRTCEEIILQRRKTNSPTIEDDFTVDLDDDEPFDEPTSSPRKEKLSIAEVDESDNLDAEIDMLCWTGSDLDVDNDKKENHPENGDSKERTDIAHVSSSKLKNKETMKKGGDTMAKSKLETNQFEQRDEVEDHDRTGRSTHSLVWSGSDLDDATRDNIDNQIKDHVDQRDDGIVKTKENEGEREDCADGVRAKQQNPSSTRIHNDIAYIHAILKNGNNHVGEERPQPSEAHGVTFADHETDKSNPDEDIGIRTERSTDSLMEGIDQGCDELSAFSLAASVAASVTKRTRNTKTGSKYPRSPCCSTVFNDVESTMGQATVATADVEAGMATGVSAITCSLLQPKKVEDKGPSPNGKNESSEDEDLLDRFFENIESRVCPTPKQGGKIAERDRNIDDGFKRLINPFIDQLEKFDSVFEQLESIACPEEGENSDAKTVRTPVAFAAAKFTELLDKFESFEQSKENACKNDCNFEFDEEDFKELHEDVPSENTPYDALEIAIKNAEEKVKEQKRSSFKKKDQLQQLKEQWFAARLNWKLKQAILAEVVKQKTAEAAKRTTKYVDTMVSSCQPSVAGSDLENKKRKDSNKKNRTKRNKSSSILKKSSGHESEADVHDDASSIGQSGFFSVMSQSEHSNINSKRNDFRSNILSPSEHSNIDSGRQNFRSTMHGATSEDEMSESFFSYADNVLRSPMNLLSPASRNCASEHSHIHSSRRSFRSNVHDAASEDEMSASFLSFTDNKGRSPGNLTPSSLNSDSIANTYFDEEGEEDEDDIKANVGVSIGVSTGPLSVIAEAPSVESMTSSNDRSNREHPKKIKSQQKSKPALRRWAYPAPSYYNEKGGDDASIPLLDKLKGTVESVYTVSERILDRAQCASATINFAESNSFEDDHEETHHQVQKRHERSDSIRSSSRRSMERQNSIVEDEKQGGSVIAGPEKKGYKKNYDERSVCDDDDLSGFESALNTMGSVHDERPPMLRLLKERNDSRSCGSSCGGSESNKSKSKIDSGSGSGNAHSRLSSEVPGSYSLADSIRHASLSAKNNQANRTRVSKEPRGNKLKNDPSTHIRKNHLPPHLFPPPPPTPNMKKEDSDFKSETQQRIRSPRSSETNETSDMTAVTASSSDFALNHLADSTHSKRSMVIQSMNIDNKTTSVSMDTTSADDDGDKGTIFSYNTSSTGSTEFKDCYQDAIPSLSTMGTVLEDEQAQSAVDRAEQKIQIANVQEVNPDTAFLPSDENIVKSMALLSVSATVFEKSGNGNNQAESISNEIESVPSTSHDKSEILEDTIVEESLDSEPMPMESLKSEELRESLATLQESEDIRENDQNGNTFDENPEDKLLESKQEDGIFTEEVREDVAEDPAMGIDSSFEKDIAVHQIVQEGTDSSFEKDVTIDQIMQEGTDSSFEKDVTVDQIMQELSGSSLEKEIAVDQIMQQGTVDSDELILESLKRQESLKYMEEQLSMDKAIENTYSKQKAVSGELVMIEAPILERIGEEPNKMEQQKLQMSLEDDPAMLATSITKASSKGKVSLTVEDRRKRRLRQRRKFEAVLRGEDDSSSMSSLPGRGTATKSEHNDESPLIARVPLISASFDTGFQ